MDVTGTFSAEPLVRLALALAIGLLVGLERGWRERNEPDGSRTAGIRTYGVIGLLGGTFALLSNALAAPAVLIAGFIIFAVAMTVYRLREAIAEDDFSITAVIAGMAVFALGALAVLGDTVLAAAGGASLAGLLASREVLHGLLKRMSWIELRSALVLVAMTVIVLPILPDRTIDPWDSVNPREIWLFTVIVAGLSYFGYVATKLLGTSRGPLVSALFGAIVSSTAVTVALARQSRDAPATMAGAAALAAAISISRVCLIVAVSAPQIALGVAIPALSAALVFVAAGLMLVRRQVTDPATATPLRNPFDLLPLAAFALSFAVIAAVSAYLRELAGPGGMMATSAVSALFDVDVAVLTAVRQAASSPTGPIVGAVLIALLANGAGRAFLAVLAGTMRFSAFYLAVTLLAATTGAVTRFL